MIIDLFLVALLSLVCLVLTDSSSLVTRLTEECHRSDGERSLEWQTPAVAYPFGSLHDLCVAVVVVLLDEVVRHFRQDLSILLIICQSRPYFQLFIISACGKKCGKWERRLSVARDSVSALALLHLAHSGVQVARETPR